jgi:rhodanese-related sulfurtransferase
MILLSTIALTTAALMTMHQQDAGRDTIMPAEVQQLLEKDSTVFLLDVRTEEEYNGATGHLRGSVLIPVQELAERIGELAPHKKNTIIAICRSGNRSGWATSMLRSQGYPALNMVGGMIRWNSEGRPVEHSERK